MLLIHKKYHKSHIPYISQTFYPPKNAKFGQQIEFTTKHRIFSYKCYQNPENFTPSRMVWMVTFWKSAVQPHAPLPPGMLGSQGD